MPRPDPVTVLRNDAEPIPAWLASYQPGRPFPKRQFFASRIVYYPGSGTDGHPLRTFGKAHTAHCFVYVDFDAMANWLREELRDENHRGHPAGYRLIHLKELTKKDLFPRAWTAHCAVPDPSRLITNDNAPFAMWAVLERLDTFSADHGPQRISVLYVCWDAYLTFDALFCQRAKKLPYAVLLHDHGFGGNWAGYTFGSERSVLWKLVYGKGGIPPKWLLVEINATEPWPGYERVSTEDCGGNFSSRRSLYQLSPFWRICND